MANDQSGSEVPWPGRLLGSTTWIPDMGPHLYLDVLVPKTSRFSRALSMSLARRAQVSKVDREEERSCPFVLSAETIIPGSGCGARVTWALGWCGVSRGTVGPCPVASFNFPPPTGLLLRNSISCNVPNSPFLSL